MLQALQRAQSARVTTNRASNTRNINSFNHIVDPARVNAIKRLPAIYQTGRVVTDIRYDHVLRTTTPYEFNLVQITGDQNELYFVPRYSSDTPSTAEITEPTAESEQSTVILDAEPTEHQPAEANGELVDDGDDDSTALAGIAAQFEHVDFEMEAAVEEALGVGRATAYDTRERELEKTMNLLMRGLRREESGMRDP